MVLTDNDKKTIELILTNIKGKEKLSDEEKLFKRFYDEYQKSNDSLSRDGQKFIRAFIKDFRYQQKREKERLKQQYVLSKEQKAKKKAEANRRLVNGMCVAKAQDSFDAPYFFELLFATLGVMSESDQKKLNIKKINNTYALSDIQSEKVNVIHVLGFTKIIDGKSQFVEPTVDYDFVVYQITKHSRTDEKNKPNIEKIHSSTTPKKSTLGDMITKSLLRNEKQIQLQKNIEQTKKNLTLEIP